MEETGFQKIADDLAIRALVARYADAVSRHDVEAWAATWADDASWTIGGSTSEGKVKIVETFRRLMALFEIVIQLPESGLLELNGDTASGRWYVTERGRIPNGNQTATLGVYTDRYRREDGDWKFSERIFEILLTG